MGFMMYDSSTRIDFEDRVLAHVEVVVISKLRRHESFAMTWREALAAGSGRSTIWVDPSIPLRFRYDGSRPPSLSREWVDRLAESASSSSGLLIIDEEGEAAIGHTHELGS